MPAKNTIAMSAKHYETVFPVVAKALLATPNLTTKQIGVKSVDMSFLLKEGLVQVTERLKQVDPETGDFLRGRPASVFALTPKARKRAQRLPAKVAA